MTKPKYNLTAAEALAEMKILETRMKAETDRKQLVGISPDDAFEMGFHNAVISLDILTGPDPQVVLAAMKREDRR